MGDPRKLTNSGLKELGKQTLKQDQWQKIKPKQKQKQNSTKKETNPVRVSFSTTTSVKSV